MKNLVYIGICVIFAIGGGCIYGETAAAERVPPKTTGQAARQVETLFTEGKEENRGEEGRVKSGEESTTAERNNGPCGRTTTVECEQRVLQKSLGSRENNKPEAAPGEQDLTQREPETAERNGVYNGSDRTVSSVNLGTFTITAYTAGYESTQKKKGEPGYGITATGTKVQEGRTIAADWNVLPPGTQVKIEGLEGVYTVEDRGGGVKGNHIDLYIENLSNALKWGRQKCEITVVTWGEAK